jgi:hypothetical protein
MELHEQPVTKINFINEKKFSKQQVEGARDFLTRLFEKDNELYKKGVKNGSIVLKGGREGTLIKNEEKGVTYKVIGQCIGSTLYVDDIKPTE